MVRKTIWESFFGENEGTQSRGKSWDVSLSKVSWGQSPGAPGGNRARLIQRQSQRAGRSKDVVRSAPEQSVHVWIGEAEKLALLSSCSAGPGLGCWLCFSSNGLFCFQQSYAPAPHPMAPPSPSTNSSSNHSTSNSSGEQLSKTNLYIRGLPPGTTDQDLIKLCQP